MTAPQPGAGERFAVLETNPMLAWLICLACAGIMFATVREVPSLGAGGAIVDFDVFYIVGQMIWDGTLPQAYDIDTMRAIQKSITGEDTFMPWTYPPHFDLVAALLPFGSRGLSYAVFITVTFLGYIYVLRRLAGPYLTAVLIALLPALVMTMRIGQNGFMTAALVGLFCLSFLNARTVAGVPLGLMVIKPHLALGLGVLVLVTRRWKVLVLGLAVVAAVSALATLAFGTEVWPAFLASVPEAQESMKRGLYPMFRMTSAYAALFTLGMAPGSAMIVQACIAVAACAAIVVASVRGMPMRQLLGLSCFATLAISPYNYDYDMPILGVGFALMASDLMARARPVEKLALLGLTWLSCGWGMAMVTLRRHLDISDSPPDQVSLAAFGHLLLIGLVWHILRREPVPQHTAVPAGERVARV